MAMKILQTCCSFFSFFFLKFVAHNVLQVAISRLLSHPVHHGSH